MRVLPVINTNCSSYKNNRKASNGPSFNGIIPKGISTFWAAPAEHLLDFSSRINDVNSTKEAMAKLSQMQSGAFVKTAQGFVFKAWNEFFATKPKDFKGVEEVIFRRPTETYWSNDRSTQVQIRPRIKPSDIIKFLQTEVKEITAIDLDRFETIRLPKDAKDREQAYNDLKYCYQARKENSVDFEDVRFNPLKFSTLVDEMYTHTRVKDFCTELGDLPGKQVNWSF